ncbi:MAG TPA: amino acid ABC transporter substrate-binding protein [Burkholderiales bacterium]
MKLVEVTMKGRLLVFLLALLLAAPALAQTGTLARIKRTGAITMGYIDGAAPFSFNDGNLLPQGYSVDICRAVAEGIRAQLGLANLNTRWVALTIQNRIEAVRKKRVDVECSTTSWTLSRQALVDFSLITFLDGGSILVKAEADTVRLGDFNGKRVAVIKGTTTEKALREALALRSIKAEVVTVIRREDGLVMLNEAKVDGFASDRTTLIGVVLTTPTRSVFKLLDEDFSVEPYALMLPRGDYDFRLAVNRVLAKLYRNGEIKPIYDRWLGPLGPPSLMLSATYFIQGLAE